MTGPGLTPLSVAWELAPCEGASRRAGGGGRAALAAAPEVAQAAGGDVRRGVRVTPPATPDALGGVGRIDAPEALSCGPLSAPETLRRGAERGPHSEGGWAAATEEAPIAPRPSPSMAGGGLAEGRGARNTRGRR